MICFPIKLLFCLFASIRTLYFIRESGFVPFVTATNIVVLYWIRLVLVWMTAKFRLRSGNFTSFLRFSHQLKFVSTVCRFDPPMNPRFPAFIGHQILNLGLAVDQCYLSPITDTRAGMRVLRCWTRDIGRLIHRRCRIMDVGVGNVGPAMFIKMLDRLHSFSSHRLS